MMKKSATIAIGLILSLSAFAAPKGKPVVHEKYAATEEDGTAKTISVGKPIDSPADDEILDQKIESPKAVPVAAKAVKVEKDDEDKFDVVPKDKVEEIAERVKYAYEILKKHGRAYDYRSTTLRELKTTLANLDSSEKN